MAPWTHRRPSTTACRWIRGVGPWSPRTCCTGSTCGTSCRTCWRPPPTGPGRRRSWPQWSPPPGSGSGAGRAGAAHPALSPALLSVVPRCAHGPRGAPPAFDEGRPMDPWGRPLVSPDVLHRLDLRYFLSDVMASAPDRSWTPAELAAVVAAAGFRVQGRPGKVVSDHLRAEVHRGRVERIGRGRSRAGTRPGDRKNPQPNARH